MKPLHPWQYEAVWSYRRELLVDTCLSLLASSPEARQAYLLQGEPCFELEFAEGLAAFHSYSDLLLYSSLYFVKTEGWGSGASESVADWMAGLLTYITQKSSAEELDWLMFRSEEGNVEDWGIDDLIRNLAKKLLRARRKKPMIPSRGFAKVFLVRASPGGYFFYRGHRRQTSYPSGQRSGT